MELFFVNNSKTSVRVNGFVWDEESSSTRLKSTSEHK